MFEHLMVWLPTLRILDNCDNAFMDNVNKQFSTVVIAVSVFATIQKLLNA